MKTMPRHELPVIPTANLVDIAILLIIFYMACSNFVSQQPGGLKLPQSPDIDKLSEPLVLAAQGVIDVKAVRAKAMRRDSLRDSLIDAVAIESFVIAAKTTSVEVPSDLLAPVEL